MQSAEHYVQHVVGLRAQNPVVVNSCLVQGGSVPAIIRQALTDVSVDAQEQIKNALLKMDSMCEQRLALGLCIFRG